MEKGGHVPLKPLGFVKEVLDGFGVEIAYPYDDLVFVEHNLYLLQFGERGEDLYFRENIEAAPEELEGQYEILKSAFQQVGITLEKRGPFSVDEAGENRVQVRFH